MSLMLRFSSENEILSKLFSSEYLNLSTEKYFVLREKMFLKKLTSGLKSVFKVRLSLKNKELYGMDSEFGSGIIS